MTLVDALPADPSADALYDAFTGWAAQQGLSLYPHQEEAAIELFERQQRRAGDADGLGQVDGRGRRALRRAGRRALDLLHGADQGAGVGEVLRAVRDLRRRERRDAHRRRVGQRRRADHLLHGGGAGQHRAARGRRRGRRPGRDGRVSLLRRRPARLGVAGAAAQPAPGAVPADVGDARRRPRDRDRPDAAHGSRDGAHRRRRAAGTADLLVVGRAAARVAGGAGRVDQAPIYVVHFTQASAMERAQSLLSAKLCTRAGARRDRRGDRRLPLHRRLRPHALQAGARRHRRPPRRDAAALPAPGRAARADRLAEGDLRHRHARRRHQRPDPHRGLHGPGEVRRHAPPAAEGARVPPDRRARRAGGVRHLRLRRRAGARARDRAHARAGQGGRRPEEAPQGPDQEAGRRRGELDRGDVRAPAATRSPSRSCRACASTTR